MTTDAVRPIIPSRSATLAERWVAAFSLIWVAWVLLSPLRSDAPIITFPFDDTFYYLQIARNLAHGHGSTFNGVVTTNGYHPLWLLVLTGVSAISTRYTFILGFLIAAEVTAATAVYLLARKLFANVAGPGVAASGVALVATSLVVPMLATGMETVLAVPFALATLAYLTEIKEPIGFKQGAILGLLTSLTVLSRLDSAILFGLLALAGGLNPAFRKFVTRPGVFGALLGLAPLAFYLFLNHSLFETWLPVSGQAKQLKPFGFSFALFSQYLVKTQAATSVLPFLAVVLIPGHTRKLNPVHLTFFLAAIAFPFVHCALLACLSDWPLWEWYAYSVPIAFVGACSWAFGAKVYALATRPLLQWSLVAYGAMLCLYGRLPIYPDIGEGALKISQFAMDHPGVYAMGDRSGTVGYVLDQPLVQTEGLVMDAGFLKKIRAQRDLLQVLKGYRVRYYVSSTLKPFQSGPFKAIEPALAGPQSPKMRSTISQPPVAEFMVSGWYTRIFDLDSGPLGPPQIEAKAGLASRQKKSPYRAPLSTARHSGSLTLGFVPRPLQGQRRGPDIPPLGNRVSG